MISTSAVLLRRLTLFDDTLKNLRSGLDKGPIIIRRDLFPVIKDKAQFDLEGRKKQAQEYLINLMKLTDSEKSYLEFFTTP
mgnify:CR=1 FL=1